MWWNIIYFDKHNGIVPFFPDFIIRLFVSIFICNFAGEIMNCVAHYLHLATFRFYYCSCSGTEVRLNGSLMLRAGFNTYQFIF